MVSGHGHAQIESLHLMRQVLAVAVVIVIVVVVVVVVVPAIRLQVAQHSAPVQRLLHALHLDAPTTTHEQGLPLPVSPNRFQLKAGS